MWKGYHLSIEGIRKGYLFREKWYIKGSGVGPWGGASLYKHLLSTPFPELHVAVDLKSLFMLRFLFCITSKLSLGPRTSILHAYKFPAKCPHFKMYFLSFSKQLSRYRFHPPYVVYSLICCKADKGYSLEGIGRTLTKEEVRTS